MELSKYTGTIHPEEWLKQVKAYCHLKDIVDEQKILKFCKFMVDSNITIPDEIKSLDELVNALKSHSTFKVYKDSCKIKLQMMKYDPEKDTATFLANFRSLCNDAGINNPDEIKILLINSYSNEFFKAEFAKNLTGINSIDEILNRFSNVVSDELRAIKPDSLVTLKHVATGKYLSSCQDVRYNRHQPSPGLFAGNPSTQAVFADNELSLDANSNALWLLKVIREQKKEDPPPKNAFGFGKTQSDNTGFGFGQPTRTGFGGFGFNQKEDPPPSLFGVTSQKAAQKETPLPADKIVYGYTINLTHKATNKYLNLANNLKSPATGQFEINCEGPSGFGLGSAPKNTVLCIKPTNNINTSYVKSGDIVTLNFPDGYILRSHDFTFAFDNKIFQEVVGHQERIGGSDEWQIEIALK